MANQPDLEMSVSLHVVRHNEKWAVKTEMHALPSFLFDSREEAVSKARELSHSDAAEIVVHAFDPHPEKCAANGAKPEGGIIDDFKIFRHCKGWAVSNGSVEHPLFIYSNPTDAITKAKELSLLYSKPFSFRR